MLTRSKARNQSETECLEIPEKKEKKKDKEEAFWTFTPTLLCFYLVLGLVCYFAYPKLLALGAYATLLFYTGAVGVWAWGTLALFVLKKK